MAEKIQCSVEDEKTRQRCDRWFIPGAGGARGKCWMHLQREYRNSKRATLIASLHGQGRTKQCMVRLAGTLRHVITQIALDEGKTFSAWVSETVERAVDGRAGRKGPYRVANMAPPDTRGTFYLNPATLKAVRVWVEKDGGNASEWMLHAIAHEVQRRTRRRPQAA